MGDLAAVVHQLKGKRVVILADLVADVFLYGEISRISREAPVLILNHRDTQQVPGGGANAIHNVWTLGGIPYPIGVVGEDSEGERLLSYFSGLGIDISGIEKVAGYRTPTKMRVLAGMPHGYRQQVVRLDWGSTLCDQKNLGRVRKRLKAALKDADALILSDYGYGVVSPEMIETIRLNHLPVTLDSRFSMQRFPGVTAATPNESEVEAILGVTIGNDLETLSKAGRALR
jgi:rfaE bifunctional protein kinase chain/domain